MPMSKELYKTESKLIELQNSVNEINAKLDAHMKATMKPEDLKNLHLPAKLPAPDAPASTPYLIKPSENPASTIAPPVVPPMGEKVVPPKPVEDELPHKNTMEAPETLPEEEPKSELEKSLGAKPAMEQVPASSIPPAPLKSTTAKPAVPAKLPEEPLV